MNIILIGMPGCGKSTVGVVLAKTIGYRFVDTDLIIQENEGRLLQNIIDHDGLDMFLKAEEKALCTDFGDNLVIATGGSAVYSQRGMANLKSKGKAVYLKLPEETIEKRIDNLDNRGIAGAGNKSLKQIFEERVPLYEKYADIVVECDELSIPSVVQKIRDKVGFQNQDSR